MGGKGRGVFADFRMARVGLLRTHGMGGSRVRRV